MVILAVGAGLTLLGLVLLMNVGGSASAVIRHVTSRDLGTLAPGYAGTRTGFRVYAVLVLAIGIACAGLGVSLFSPIGGAAALGLGVGLFAIASVVAIRGEIKTYRSVSR